MAWHYNTTLGCGLSRGDLAQRRRQGDAEGGKREAGGGTRGGAQLEALAVLFDFGLGERVEVGDDGGPRGAGAIVRRGEAVLQLLLEHQREEAARYVAADRRVELVKDRPRLEQTFCGSERSLNIPYTLPLII